jgi:sterol desaturase/sphingolipid hydroxylase (fatty acid hydroxylase superfamily)
MRRSLRSVIRYFGYPGLLGGSLVILGVLLANGAALSWAPYAAVALVGPAILVAERILPYRPNWNAGAADLADDVFFLVAVQMAVPLALVWLTTFLVQGYLSRNGWTSDIWPVHWPILAQLALKVVAGDFFRYWLHRAAHTWPPLWRLHEVHHHPEKLYTTNVFRFHPLEKALQFFCDTFPFILLGIGVEALAYYFVFYALSGLLQHANIDVRLGWLNYIFSGPEVHRWHHARKIFESNHNYAHSFVVWDIVFGTYFRPRDRQVTYLGLLDPEYPRGFLRQLAAPFRAGNRPDVNP